MNALQETVAARQPARIRAPTGFGKATAIVLMVYAATIVFELIGQVVAMQALSSVNPETQADLFDSSFVLGNAGLLFVLAFMLRFAVLLGTGIVLAVWIYRVNATAKKLAKNKEVSPAWAVGWFLIPIGNLWKPFQAMDETWKISTEPTRWKALDTPGLLRLWWGLSLGGSFSSNIIFRLGNSAHDAGHVLTLHVFWALYDVVLIAAVGCMFQIVREITKRQAAAVSRNVFD